MTIYQRIDKNSYNYGIYLVDSMEKQQVMLDKIIDYLIYNFFFCIHF